MRTRRVIGGVVGPAALAGAPLHPGPPPPAEAPPQPLPVGSSQPRPMDDFPPGVPKDVDGYWTKQFADAGLPEPRVSYDWVPAGQSIQSACGVQSGDSAAAYCPGDDTIYVADQFA